MNPDLRIKFDVLPSWNDFLGIARHAGAAQGMMATWRKKGMKAALAQSSAYGAVIDRWTESNVSEKGRITEVAKALIRPRFFLDSERVRLELHYWRATYARYDNFSPLVKPIIDGFVDAGVIIDDSYDHIPEYSVKFEGVDSSLKPSPEARAARKVKALGRKKSQPMPARYHFDFYRL